MTIIDQDREWTADEIAIELAAIFEQCSCLLYALPLAMPPDVVTAITRLEEAAEAAAAACHAWSIEKAFSEWLDLEWANYLAQVGDAWTSEGFREYMRGLSSTQVPPGFVQLVEEGNFVRPSENPSKRKP